MKLVHFLTVVPGICTIFFCSCTKENCQRITVENNTKYDLNNVMVVTSGAANDCVNSELNNLNAGKNKKAYISTDGFFISYLIELKIEGLMLEDYFFPHLGENNKLSIDSVNIRDSLLYTRFY